METVILFAILGLGAGATYAIMGLGIVLIHKGSGTVNFAHGAIAGCAALTFGSMASNGTPKLLALLITLVGAAVLGGLFHLAVMKPLREAPLLARVVTTLGLLIALQGLAVKIWGVPSFSAPSLFPTKSISVFGVAFGVDRLYLLGVTVVIALVLWGVYKYTRFGLATRATAESERGAALLGYSPDTVGMVNWGLGCMLAALAGILIAPIASLDIQVMSLLILPALAAALVGRFSSFAITCIVAIAIGIVQSLLTRYWTQPGVSDAFPFLVVMAAMIVTGKLIPSRGTLAVNRPPLSPSPRFRPLVTFGFVALAIIGLVVLNNEYQSGIATTCIMAGTALSLVTVTGFVGQISLAQMTFAGIAGLLVSKFAINAGIPFPWPILLAGLVLLPVGIALGLPALRVRGINLAIVTLGVSVAVSGVLFGNLAWTGGLEGSKVPSPSLWSFSIDSTDHPVRFGIFALVVLTGTVLMVQTLRRSASGRRMLAVRSNERAAAVAGVNVEATKLQAFAFSALLAGIAGGVLAYQIGAVGFERFNPMASVMLLALVYIGGIAVVGGAVVAGVIANGGILYVALSQFGGLDSWWSIMAGLGLLVTALTQPDGAMIAWKKQGEWIMRKLRRDHGATPPPVPPAPVERPADVRIPVA
jgi:branched-chain amino acid transport system permease protein